MQSCFWPDQSENLDFEAYFHSNYKFGAENRAKNWGELSYKCLKLKKNPCMRGLRKIGADVKQGDTRSKSEMMSLEGICALQ